MFSGWFSSPLLIPSPPSIDGLARNRASEQTSVHIWPTRAYPARGNRMGNSASIKCFTGASNQRRAAPSMTTRKHVEMKFYIIQRRPSPPPSPAPVSFSLLAKCGQLVNRTRVTEPTTLHGTLTGVPNT